MLNAQQKEILKRILKNKENAIQFVERNQTHSWRVDQLEQEAKLIQQLIKGKVAA